MFPNTESIILTRNPKHLIQEFGQLLKEAETKALKTKEYFLLGVSGGSCVKYFLDTVDSIEAQFNKWVIFFCDERVVAENDPDSTYGTYISALSTNERLKHKLSKEQFKNIKQGVSADEAAKDYSHQMDKFKSDASPFTKFDFLLLGMGPDGHTCSLFPGHKLLDETSVSCAPITDSPKPPPCRITLTFPVLNKAACSVFIAAGESKADMIKRIHCDRDLSLPATRVTNAKWILDEGAAKYLPKKD